MMKETELFFQNLMQQDGNILDLVDGKYSYLNERLARHYGIKGVTGAAFRKVALTGTKRSGILTQASVLTVSSYGNRTSPVLRGKWVLENILNAPPPAAPGNVPPLDETAVGSSASLRQQMEQPRKNPVMIGMMARLRDRTLTEADRKQWGEYIRKRDLSPSIENQRVFRRQRPNDKADYIVEIKGDGENKLNLEMFSR